MGWSRRWINESAGVKVLNRSVVDEEGSELKGKALNLAICLQYDQYDHQGWIWEKKCPESS